MRRGEIRWYTFSKPDKRRPVLLLSCDVVADTLNEMEKAATEAPGAGFTIAGTHAAQRARTSR